MKQRSFGSKTLHSPLIGAKLTRPKRKRTKQRDIIARYSHKFCEEFLSLCGIKCIYFFVLYEYVASNLVEQIHFHVGAKFGPQKMISATKPKRENIQILVLHFTCNLHV